MKGLGSRTVDLCLLAVGLVDTFLVGVYAVVWNQYTGSGLIEAIGFSIAITGGSTIFFEFGVYEFLKTRMKRWFLLFIPWFAIALYSMQTTVAGQYIGIMKESQAYDKANGQAINAKGEMADLIDEIGRLQVLVLPDQKRIASIDLLLSQALDLQEAASYRSTMASLREERSLLSKKVESSAKRIQVLQDRKLELSSGQSSSLKVYARTDVFLFYKSVLHLGSTEAIQFILAVFKGIVLDLINILCFMFLIIRRQEDVDLETEVQGPGDQHQLLVGEDKGAEEGKGGPLGQVGDAGTETEKPRGTARSLPVYRLAAYLYRAGGQSKSGAIISQQRSKEELGIAGEDYRRIVQKGLLHGVLRRNKGRVYHVAGYSEDEFIREVS